MKPELYVVLIADIFLSAVQRSYYLYKPNTKQYVPLIFSVLIGYLGYMGLVGVIKEVGRNNLEGFILLSVFSGMPIIFTFLFLRTFVQFHDDGITYRKFGRRKKFMPWKDVVELEWRKDDWRDIFLYVEDKSGNSAKFIKTVFIDPGLDLYMKFYTRTGRFPASYEELAKKLKIKKQKRSFWKNFFFLLLEFILMFAPDDNRPLDIHLYELFLPQ